MDESSYILTMIYYNHNHYAPRRLLAREMTLLSKEQASSHRSSRLKSHLEKVVWVKQKGYDNVRWLLTICCNDSIILSLATVTSGSCRFRDPVDLPFIDRGPAFTHHASRITHLLLPGTNPHTRTNVLHMQGLSRKRGIFFLKVLLGHLIAIPQDDCFCPPKIAFIDCTTSP